VINLYPNSELNMNTRTMPLIWFDSPIYWLSYSLITLIFCGGFGHSCAHRHIQTNINTGTMPLEWLDVLKHHLSYSPINIISCGSFCHGCGHCHVQQKCKGETVSLMLRLGQWHWNDYMSSFIITWHYISS
jgi:hypothetical protein